MTQGPKFGVVVSTYKRDEPLQRLLRSMLPQTMKPNQVVVVDDAGGMARGAVDAVQAEFDEAGIPISCAELERNSRYMCRPRNAGYCLLDEDMEFVSYCDDDDELLPRHFESHITAAVEHEADIVYSLFRVVLDNTHKIPKHVTPPPQGFEQPFVQFNSYQLVAGPEHNFITSYQTHRLSFMAEHFGMKPWNEEIMRFGDWEICLRAFGAGAKFHGVDEITLLYHLDGTNLHMNRSVSLDTLKDFKADTRVVMHENRKVWDGMRSVGVVKR